MATSVFTIDDVASQARTILQDVDKERYTDQQVLAGLNTAIAEMMRVRPDIVALQSPITAFPFTAAQLGTGVRIPVSDMYVGPLVSFTVGWAELADDEFTMDSRAATLLGRFQTQLVAGG